MSNFITLQCPTCGAGLQVAGEKNHFACDHCGNRYLLDRKLEDIEAADREHIEPSVTYTHQIQQGLRVGEYEVCLYNISMETVKQERVLYIDVPIVTAQPRRSVVATINGSFLIKITTFGNCTKVLWHGCPLPPLPDPAAQAGAPNRCRQRRGPT